MAFTDDLVTRLKLDGSQYQQGLAQAGQSAKGFGSVWDAVASRFVITGGDVVGTVQSIGRGLVQMVERGGAVGDVMAATAVDVVGAQKAVVGLVSKMDLAVTANRILESGLELTNEQFQVLAKAAAVVAQRTGQDTVRTMEKMSAAFISGRVGALKPFGVAIDDIDSKLSESEKLLAIKTEGLRQLAVVYKDATVAIDDAGDVIQQTNVKLQDGSDRVAQLVAENQLMILAWKGVGHAVEGVNAVVAGGFDLWNETAEDLLTIGRLTSDLAVGTTFYKDALTAALTVVKEDQLPAFRAVAEALADINEELGRGGGTVLGGGGGLPARRPSGRPSRMPGAERKERGPSEAVAGPSVVDIFGAEEVAKFEELAKQEAAVAEQGDIAFEAMLKLNAGIGQTAVVADEQVIALADASVSLQRYQEAMAGAHRAAEQMASFMAGRFGAEVGAGMNAMIGSSVRIVEVQHELTKAEKESAAIARASALTTAEAFKVRAREVIKAMAVEATARAAMEFAMGLALSFLNPPAAGAHFAAAGAFAAIAGAAVGLAASIGPVTKVVPARGAGPSSPPLAPSERRGEGTGGGETNIINLNLRIDPTMSAEDVGRAVYLSLQAYARDRGRRLVIEA